MFNKKLLHNIPKSTGIYIFKNKQGKVIYVGKALNIRERVKSYFLPQTSIKNSHLVNEVNDYSIIEVYSEVEALILEANLIKKYLPQYNVSLRDDKSFLYIAISKEEFPRVLPFRKNDKSIPIKKIYGPFPSSTAVRNVLKIIRKIFPYCVQSPRSKKPCFYSHIGLCNPCPAFIKMQIGTNIFLLFKKKYLSNIKNIKKFLDGKLKNIASDQTKIMSIYSQKQMYEKASQTLKIIKQIEYISTPYYKISQFLDDPNFLENENQKAGGELEALLKPYFPNLKKIVRIEGIDISNIMGKESSGSLVTFIGGKKQPSLYKRFKLKCKGPNDVLMIKEVLERRIKHKEWESPDLFLIDGGKPQVSAANQVMFENNTDIPIIGLAKSREIIVIKKGKEFYSISLKRQNRALRLLQQIRDEAHRFAKKYHHKLREKMFLKK